MARMVPPYFNPDTSNGEKDLFQWLKNSVHTEGWTVFHSLNISEHVRNPNGEADFVIVAPNKGILVLEVKGCKKVKYENRTWYYGEEQKGDVRGPFLQADEARRSIKAYLDKNAPDLKDVPFYSAVVFTYCQLNVKSMEWREWQCVDSRDLNSRSMDQIICNIFSREQKHLEQTQKQCKGKEKLFSLKEANRMVEILKPQLYTTERLADRISRTERERIHFTKEQFDALDVIEANDHVVFNGPAGTGKTFLALEAARRLALSGIRTLFLCFNKNLGAWLEGQTKDIPDLTVQTLHHCMVSAGNIDVPENASANFWKVQLPYKAVQKVNAGSCPVYDCLILDEAQDIICPEYVVFLEYVLNGGFQNGRWYFFGDFDNQNLYLPEMEKKNYREMDRKIPHVRYPLKKNCRNTPRIASFISKTCKLDPDYSAYLRTDGDMDPEIHYYHSEKEQKQLLEKTLARLLEELDEKEIVVLSLKKECIASKISGPLKEKLKPFPKTDEKGVFYATIHSFKGLESSIVILTDLESKELAAIKSLFYVGATRAKDQLYIFAHSDLQPILEKARETQKDD
ncbi:MAG: NERD domain-containing protein [Planctomycetia bacterium]|nr:NERD domain-containing protein [Planctomycetia bacterium]